MDVLQQQQKQQRIVSERERDFFIHCSNFHQRELVSNIIICFLEETISIEGEKMADNEAQLVAGREKAGEKTTTQYSNLNINRH